MAVVATILLASGALFIGVTALPAGATACSSTTPPSSYASPDSCTINATVTIDSGNYAIAESDNGSVSLGTVTLTGYNAYTESNNDIITAVDATGSGGGWNLTASATGFTTTSGPSGNCSSTTPCTLENVELSYNGDSAPTTGADPSTSCDSGSTCTDNSAYCTSGASLSYPIALSSTAADICAYSSSNGMGAVNLSSMWWLSIPGNTYSSPYAGSGATFSSTITLTLSSGP
jgi:hypothetical protein